ncbi:Reverse transcriptase [Pseudomonas asiatica]|uniref:RNA-directed DNA polymerase n=1 Tax=Pseudomonas asiatica TaxID=2219225 RepID=UPI0015FC31A9|nr:RNA-directed DNA polymerase [Pseudomonas asiatica]MBA6113572.1 Reverse transcriptase [Pseudomonas asiatica]
MSPFSVQSLGLAYRKAKVDLYYSSHASLEAIAEYEENLHANLSALSKRILADEETWVDDPDFLGGWTLATKSVDMRNLADCRKEKGNGIIFSSPIDEWEQACLTLATQDEPKKPVAVFRVMAKCSLDFHVLSALWIMKVGHLFDAKLTECASGNRLRRTEDGNSINPVSIGSFRPYLKPFRDWRDKGIRAMRTALDDGKKVVALTADVTSFYHELNPAFMLDPKFIAEVLGLTLSEEQNKLNRLFIRALEGWAKRTPLKKGLPVGLPASAVVANVALIELDRIIERQVAPIYYGRYVDDIMLVMENGADFRSSSEVWEWLFARADGKLAWDDSRKQILFSTDYLKACGNTQVRFANSKNKVFVLAGDSGRTLVDAIAHQVRQRASEWRAMPRLPQSANNVGTDLVAATQNDGETADNLRKADALTMRRAGFAIKLRDFEAYERDLQPDSWKGHRWAFLRAFTQHVLVLPQFFDLAIYLPRVIQLATACEDFAHLRKILGALEKLCEQVTISCEIDIKACPKENLPTPAAVVAIWKEQLFAGVCESISAAYPPQLTKAGKQAWDTYMASYRPKVDLNSLSWPESSKLIQQRHARLFNFDLAHMPFRFTGLPKEMVSQRGVPAKKVVTTCAQADALLPGGILDGIHLLAKWIKLKGLPSGLLFATRPFSITELFVLNKDVYVDAGQKDLREIVYSLRGFRLSEKTPRFDSHGVLHIPDGIPPPKYGIAVSSWKTKMDSWVAAATRCPDPDAERYSRLCRMLDGVIAEPQKSRYLILPELALPAHWFIRIARKLQGRGISLITGIEYLHVSKSRVRNQVWAALSHDGLGFPSLMIYRQDKQRPALHEEQELQRLAGLEFKPDRVWKSPPIIQHGEFRFALLVCSELTNIGYRAALRGKIDALFLPEWNQDTETFNALVESAALDIHAYVIQCNDRQYGDSRIRAPFKDSWKRDVLRVKGGITDYCVIGEVDVLALRKFQSSYRSPSNPFKPVPDGFELAFERKVLPGGAIE